MNSVLQRHRRLFTTIGLLVIVPLAFWFGTAAWRVFRFQPEPTAGAAVLIDAQERVITTLGARRQPFLGFNELPSMLRTATVDIEDSRFWQHAGIDIKGIMRALWIDLRGGGIVQGGSTITQQISKWQFTNTRQTVIRKLQDAGYALLLEARFTKEQILAIYLNTIYFGEGAYGIAEAALTYFGKTVAELDLAETALLVGLPKAPSKLSPYSNPEGAIARRKVVLDRMAELGHITPQEAAEAAAAPLQLAKLRGGIAPYFADYITNQLVERFGANLVNSGGLRVYTTLDVDMQSAANSAIGDVQGAIVALDPRNGAIRAMVGGRDYIESQFNRATQALRQPGSAFKPFVYATALESGWQMNTVLNDNPQNFNGYTPQNFKGEYWGTVTMKQALASSLNNASVWLLDQIGVDNALEMAKRLGIKNLVLPDDRNLALALGGLTKGVTPLELAGGYLAFANRGVRYEPYAIEKVVDKYGRTIWQNKPRAVRVLSEETAYLITNMLQAVVEKGTGTAAHIGRPTAGKTGTTDDARNAWFVGYTPQLLAAVYVGNDTNEPLAGGGGSLSAPIWSKFAQRALRDVPAEGFFVPPGIETNIPIDIFTGLLANNLCAQQERDAFLAGLSPFMAAPCYYGAAQPQPYQLAKESNLPGEDTTVAGTFPPAGTGDPVDVPSPMPLPTPDAAPAATPATTAAGDNQQKTRPSLPPAQTTQPPVATPVAAPAPTSPAESEPAAPETSTEVIPEPAAEQSGDMAGADSPMGE